MMENCFRVVHMPNFSLQPTTQLLRSRLAAELERSSARSADERARVVPKFGFLARRAVEPSLEPHPFGATASSRTRVFAAHPVRGTVLFRGRAAIPLRAG